MKHGKKWIIWGLLLSLLLFSAPGALGEAEADSEKEALPVTFSEKEEWAVNSDGTINFDSFVRYPVFVTEDEALAPAIERVNQAIEEKAHISAYLQLLSTVSPGGAGLRMDYETGLSFSVRLEPSFHVELHDWYVSLLFSAEGKMLSGRPSQVYYPMTFNLRTGEEIAFDQLFSDPAGAKAYMESTLEEDIEPTLSTYLENNQLFPVPYDRFFLDSWGHVVIVYENSQLSFLSGTSGAVSFRYTELSDWLDQSSDGVIAHFPYWSQTQRTEEESLQTLWNTLKQGYLVACGDAEVRLGAALPPILGRLHATTDSGYYPGGIYYEVENPYFRGALLISGESGESVNGLQTSQWDLGGIQTGKTLLSDAEKYLNAEPAARVSLDETAAESYRVCAGAASVYLLEDQNGKPLTFTLYADENGVVQYVKLSYK